MKWPRGKYNGQRIGGFVIKVRFDIFWWGFSLPRNHECCLSIGPLHIWLQAAYEAKRERERFRAEKEGGDGN